jgi:nucleoside phosphorylase
MAMLDEKHTELEQQRRLDHNIYALGRIGRHNVVAACLRSGVVGSTAAIVAKDMLNTFTSLRFGLMVGIGGGVPSKGHDIRLGDVVVSSPHEKYGGVVQYDFGKKMADGRFITGVLNKPPPVLLSAISVLRSKDFMQDNKLDQYLTEMVKRYHKSHPEFTYQGQENDRLFDAEYEHVGG